MEPKVYRRLLIQLLLLPVAVFLFLAVVLSYSLERMEKSAHWVDHSDQILSHSYRLSLLIVDQETGLRGYLLTRNAGFLEPYNHAKTRIQPEFDALLALTADNAAQNGRLREIQEFYQQWAKEAAQQIAGQVQPSDLLPDHLAARESMDHVRAASWDFRRAEEALRKQRSVSSLVIDRSSLIGLLVLIALIAGLLVWRIRKVLNALTETYNRQIEQTQRKHEEAFARQQWLNTTMRSIGDGVIACDPEGKIVFMNPVAEQLTGWCEAEGRGLPLSQIFRIVNEYTRVIVESPVDKVRRLGTVVGLANHTILINKNGSELSIDDSGAPIVDHEDKMIGVVLTFHNITDRRLSDRALIRAEKLAAAGRLAASIAHEVNNPLEGLINLIYLARQHDDPEEVRRLLAQAESEINRVAHITRQALGFYREGSNPVYFNPIPFVHEVAEFYANRAAAAGISFEIETDKGSEVFGIPGELRQVLFNLLANSLDACSEGGTICLRTKVASDPLDLARAGVRITIADTGCGIPPEHMERIFEPFFTTKEETGTGLGLWVCRELVEKQGGRMKARSNYQPDSEGVASGTVFSIFLPKLGRAATEQMAESENAGAF